MNATGNRSIERYASILAIVCLIAGCEQSFNVKIESDVPDGLINQTPLTVGVYYSEAFLAHTYHENTEARKNWAISTGESQVEMFDSVLHSAFGNVTRLQQPPTGPAAGLDAVFVPNLEEIQFATPTETRFSYYEAWIKYKVEILAAGAPDWVVWDVTAYGKSPKALLTTNANGVNKAVGLALRDAGAKLITGMYQVPEIKQLMKRQTVN